MTRLMFIIAAIVMLGCSRPSNKIPRILISTSEGEIEVELFPDKAPKTVAAFLSYVDSGYYTNSSFYRVSIAEGLSASANTGMIQGGIWQTSEQQHPNVPGIPHETTKQSGLSHTSGTISLARTAPGTASTEFFICIGDQTQFDHGNGSPSDGLGFAAFGKVIKGMPVVRAIQLEKKHGESFDQKIVIKSIKRL